VTVADIDKNELAKQIVQNEAEVRDHKSGAWDKLQASILKAPPDQQKDVLELVRSLDKTAGKETIIATKKYEDKETLLIDPVFEQKQLKGVDSDIEKHVQSVVDVITQTGELGWGNDRETINRAFRTASAAPDGIQELVGLLNDKLAEVTGLGNYTLSYAPDAKSNVRDGLLTLTNGNDQSKKLMNVVLR
jgi:hypothetical protein